MGSKQLYTYRFSLIQLFKKNQNYKKKLYVSIQLPFISLKQATQKQIDSALPFYNKKSIKIFKKQK